MNDFVLTQDIHLPELPIEERSMAEQLHRSGKWDEVMSKLSIRKKAQLAHEIKFLGRRKQIIPANTKARIHLALAGRGFGKTFMEVFWLYQQLYVYGCHKVGIVGETLSEVNDVIIEGESGIMKLFPPNCRPEWNRQHRKLKFPGGKVAHVLYGDKPKQSRGYNLQAVMIDEFAKYVNPTDLYRTVAGSNRIFRPDGKRPQVLIGTTPLPIEMLRNLTQRADAGDKDINIIAGASYDNKANWPEGTLEGLMADYGPGTRYFRQEILGELLMDLEGALWKQDMFKPYYPPLVLDSEGLPIRENGKPKVDFEAMLKEFQRIVVGVDPAGAKDEKSESDEIGIVVAGRRHQGDSVLLEDASCRVGPETWGKVIINLYDKYRADRIVAEKNFGGAMVEFTIRAANEKHGRERNVSYRDVHASHGKQVRAEPIAALYEKGAVRHFRLPANVRGNHDIKRIEQQMLMTTPKGFQDTGSPDRMDAAVFALSDLNLADQKAKRAAIFQRLHANG